MFENQKKEDNVRYFEFLAERNIKHGMPIPFEAVDAFLILNTVGENEVSIAMKKIAAWVYASVSLEAEYEKTMKDVDNSGTIYDLLGDDIKEMGALTTRVWLLRKTDFDKYASKYAKKHGGDPKDLAASFRGVSSWLVSWAIIHFNRHIKLLPTVEYGRLMEQYYLAINTGERDIITKDLVAKGLLGIPTEN